MTDRQTGKLGGVLEVQFFHDVGVMDANGFGADGEDFGDFGDRMAFSQQLE